MLFLAIALTAPAGAAVDDASPLPFAEKATMDAVWSALNSQPALADQHRGFLAYLFHHPQLAAALQALRPLQRHPVFRNLMIDFDNSLARDAEVNRQFNSFYEALAADQTLRDSIDAVYRIQLSEPALQQLLVDQLADADVTLRFLTNPAKPAPASLYPLKGLLLQNEPLRGELLDTLNKLHKLPAAHTVVFPWWQKVAADRESICRPYISLINQLMKDAHRFWAWHSAQVELARDPRARDWIFCLQRQVRKDPVLSQSYDTYLDILRRRPAYAEAALNKWLADLGPAPAWPPDSAPPAVPVTPASSRLRSLEKPARPNAEKPAIKMPQMPQMPSRPTKPQAPPKPLPPHEKTSR